MTQIEIIDVLITAGFQTGWALRDNKIVLWENSDEIPTELSDFVELEELTEN